MIRLIFFRDVKIWLFIQQLHQNQFDDVKNLISTDQYLCYFKFSEPTVMIFGELIYDHLNHPKVFSSIDDAEKFANTYLEHRFHLEKLLKAAQ
jgi:hypothetical protein